MADWLRDCCGFPPSSDAASRASRGTKRGHRRNGSDDSKHSIKVNIYLNSDGTLADGPALKRQDSKVSQQLTQAETEHSDEDSHEDVKTGGLIGLARKLSFGRQQRGRSLTRSRSNNGSLDGRAPSRSRSKSRSRSRSKSRARSASRGRSAVVKSDASVSSKGPRSISNSRAVLVNFDDDISLDSTTKRKKKTLRIMLCVFGVVAVLAIELTTGLLVGNDDKRNSLAGYFGLGGNMTDAMDAKDIDCIETEVVITAYSPSKAPTSSTASNTAAVPSADQEPIITISSSQTNGSTADPISVPDANTEGVTVVPVTASGIYSKSGKDAESYSVVPETASGIYSKSNKDAATAAGAAAVPTPPSAKARKMVRGSDASKLQKSRVSMRTYKVK